MARLESFFGGVSRILLYVAAAAMLIMTTLVVVASFMRYLVGRPFAFTEELVALLYMTMVFLSVPISTIRREHISVTLLSERIMSALKHPFRILASLIMIVFNAWFSVIAFEFTAVSYNLGSRSEQVDLLLWPWMAMIPISMGFVTIISILHLWQAGHAARTGEEIAEPQPGVGEVF